MIIGVIPARGGSKGVVNKNIREIAGKPLIAWTIESALKSKFIDDFIVSTEDKKITEVAQYYGAKVLSRPFHLGTDEATTLSVLQHIIDEILVDNIVVLQPTSPIRDDDLIDRCITRFKEANADCLGTGYNCKIKIYGANNNTPRQAMEGEFVEDGNVYVMKKELIRSGKWTGGKIEYFELGGDQSYQIDTELEFFILEKLLEKRARKKIFEITKRVRLLAIDVDGVLTDSGMYYSQAGDELKKFNTRDGMGIELLRKAGVKIALITKETSKIVHRRAEKLRVDFVCQGIEDKVSSLKKIVSEMNIDFDQVAFIGDDLNDTMALSVVGFSATPKDGIEENKKIVDYICTKLGGDGCVREVCDLILSSIESKRVKKGLIADEL